MAIDMKDLATCPARITLDAAQLEFLNALPAPAPSVQSELGCELEQGHEGSHASLGQQVGPTMWWIQWTLSASEINPYVWCPTRPGEDCGLFDGHPGHHSPATRRRIGDETAA